eukprot:TRINITY_DN29394_c0_g1_i3.p1 TRINITY_DN29394_c0_g1~~TRINITY_DN29394_c0_g1_i3.p1  ORF type:complete len:235 (+),score=13.09 TRINITY_DN29394_c0_g1_i3:180-884(+)
MGRFLGIIPMPWIGKITDCRLFRKMALKSFDESDKDANGKIDEKELHICILLLYDKLNNKLPCHINVPTSLKVKELFERHDVDGDKALSQDQFLSLAADLLASEQNWWDSIFVRATFKVAVTLIVFPLVGKGVSHLLQATDLPVIRRGSPAVCSHGAEYAYKALKIPVPDLPQKPAARSRLTHGRSHNGVASFVSRLRPQKNRQMLSSVDVVRVGVQYCHDHHSHHHSQQHSAW